MSAMFLLYPADVVKTYVTMTQNQRGNESLNRQLILKMTKQLAKESGVQGFYKGAVVSCAGVAPFIAIRMSTYDFFMNSQNSLVLSVRPRDSEENFSSSKVVYSGVAGTMAGLLALTVCYPTDVVRRLM